jgi:hypothetical protein
VTTEPTASPSWVARLKAVLQAALIIIVVVFVIRYFAQQWPAIPFDLLRANWPQILLALLSMALGYSLLPLGSWRIITAMGHALTRLNVGRIFFVSNMGKYLPGGIWAFPGRALFYQRAEVPTADAISAVFWEIVLLIMSAALVGLAVTPLLLQFAPPPLVGAGIALYAGVLALVLFMPPPLLERFNITAISTGAKLHTMGVYLVSWVIMGLSFVLITGVFTGPLTVSEVIQLGGLYMFSWVAGFVVVIAPSGIGVRDGLLVVGLLLFLEPPLPGAIAIIARLLWTLAELLALAITLVAVRLNS